MKHLLTISLLACATVNAACAQTPANKQEELGLQIAKRPPFTGDWQLDFRTPAQRRALVDCGTAWFNLKQNGNEIMGDHGMTTIGCDRLNEGGEGTVIGTARGNVAELTVTSARNGEVVRGRATRVGKNLKWEVTEEVRPGDPEGLGGLILNRGLLRPSP